MSSSCESRHSMFSYLYLVGVHNCTKINFLAVGSRTNFATLVSHLSHTLHNFVAEKLVGNQTSLVTVVVCLLLLEQENQFNLGGLIRFLSFVTLFVTGDGRTKRGSLDWQSSLLLTDPDDRTRDRNLSRGASRKRAGQCKLQECRRVGRIMWIWWQFFY